jgi:uncharacterized damage-inducible protein DinB
VAWTAPDVERVEPDLVSDERTSLEQWLDFHRATLQQKCAGLTAEELATPSTPPSVLTLHGLVRHMADVERWWFRRHAGQEDVPTLFWTGSGEPDADFTALGDAQGDLDTYRAECDASRAAVAGMALDAVVPSRGHHPERVRDLRWIYVHMIEEYARHNGHADLVRERIDGAVGD